jgi:hypothetical protein
MYVARFRRIFSSTMALLLFWSVAVTVVTQSSVSAGVAKYAVLDAGGIRVGWRFVVEWADGPVMAGPNGVDFLPLQVERGSIRIVGPDNVVGYDTANAMFNPEMAGRTFTVFALAGAQGAGGFVGGYQRSVTVRQDGFASFLLPASPFSFLYLVDLGPSRVVLRSLEFTGSAVATTSTSTTTTPTSTTTTSTSTTTTSTSTTTT